MRKKVVWASLNVSFRTVDDVTESVQESIGTIKILDAGISFSGSPDTE